MARNNQRVSPTKVAFVGLAVAVVLLVAACRAQDYDDDGYGGQGSQGDGDNYGSGGQAGGNQGYGAGGDDGYNSNAPQYQQNVDSDSSNSPGSYSSSPQSGGDADGDYEGDDNSAAASAQAPTFARVKRSAAPANEESASASSIKMRVKRHSKYIGPVYTYVKTDKHANFKWGVKHKVGKKHYG